MRTGLRFMLVMLTVFAMLLICPHLALGDEVKVTIPAGAYEVIDTGAGHEVNMEGFGRLLVSGKPNLPSRIFSVALPPGAQIQQVTFLKDQETVLNGVYSVSPCPMPRVTGPENPALYEQDKKTYEANYKSVYGSDGPYPAQTGEYVGRAGFRKYNLADIRFHPFTYWPKSGTLSVCKELTVTITYTVPEVLPEDVVLMDHHPKNQKTAQEILFNYEQAQTWYPKGSASFGGYDYVIITQGSLVAAVQPMVDWEEAKGRSVKIVTLSWISYNYSGYDIQEKIRNFLRDKYPTSKWGIQYVLLVGNYDDVPMRRTAQDVGYGQPETDFYYAELSFADYLSWDLNGNHLWGENSDPIDFYAEVEVGRIPWSDPETVTHICKKSAAFEKNCDPGFKKNMLLVGSFFWLDTDSAVLMELKSNHNSVPWMADWTTTKLYEDNADVVSVYSYDIELMNKTLVEEWRNGKYSYVNWGGHGNPYCCHQKGYGAPYFIQGGDSACLNDDYPGIVFANACSNSDTDYLNIGQMLIKQGSVGFLGATKVSFGIPGWDDPYDGCGSSADYFFTLYVTEGVKTQGGALNSMIHTMYSYGLFYYVYYELFEWASIWGNPDLGYQTRGPLSISSLEGLPEGRLAPGVSLKLTVEIHDGLEQYSQGEGFLNYRYNSHEPYVQAPLNSLGNNTYGAKLPFAMPGKTVEFYFSAKGSGGSEVFLPVTGSQKPFQLDTGYDNMLHSDDFEKESGWVIENENVENGPFERAVPVGNVIQPDGNGSACFVTGKEGGFLSDHDLDGGPVKIISPEFDFSDPNLLVGFNLWFHQTYYGANTEPLEVHLSNDNGATWVKAVEYHHNGGWTFCSFKPSDYLASGPAVQVRVLANDNPNDNILEALVDDFCLYRVDEEPPFWSKGNFISAATGGKIVMTLNCDSSHGSRPYMILGSSTGTEPGVVLPDGSKLPLKWDAFSNIVFNFANSRFFKKFKGALDSNGRAKAILDTQGPIDPSMINVSLYFAFFLEPSPYYVSEAIKITIDP